MSNYNTRTQLNKITQSFSKTFNIKLSKVRNQIAKDEGFKCYDALVASLPNDIKEDKRIYPEGIANIQKRPGLYFGTLKHNELFNQIFETFVGNFKSNKSSKIKVLINKNAEISISDNSQGIEDFIFQNIKEKNSDNKNNFNHFMKSEVEDSLEYFKTGVTVNNNSFRYLILVNALSSFFNISYKENNKFFSYSFEDGILVKRKIKSKNLTNGLHISFKINLKYFRQEEISELDLERDHWEDKRVRELLTPDVYKIISSTTKLNKGLHIDLNFYNKNKHSYFHDNHKAIFHRHFYTNKMELVGCKPLDYMTLSNKDNNSNFSVSAIFVNSNDNSDFICHTYINDEYIEINDMNRHLRKEFLKSKLNYENGLKKSIKHFSDKFVVPDDFKGVKAILLVNKNENEPRKKYSDIFDRRTEEEIFNLLTNNK